MFTVEYWKCYGWCVIGPEGRIRVMCDSQGEAQSICNDFNKKESK